MSGGVTMYANDTTVMVIGQTRDKLKKKSGDLVRQTILIW